MKRRVNDKVLTKWDELIGDARRQLEAAKARVEALCKAIRNLEEIRDSGQVWPTQASDQSRKPQHSV
jgi:hypothetical protein